MSDTPEQHFFQHTSDRSFSATVLLTTIDTSKQHVKLAQTSRLYDRANESGVQHRRVEVATGARLRGPGAGASRRLRRRGVACGKLAAGATAPGAAPPFVFSLARLAGAGAATSSSLWLTSSRRASANGVVAHSEPDVSPHSSADERTPPRTPERHVLVAEAVVVGSFCRAS